MNQHFKFRMLSIISVLSLLMAAVGMPTSMPEAAPAQFEGDGVFSFASMGDAQVEAANFAATVNQVASLNPDLVLFNGDLENEGVTALMDTMMGVLKTANLYDRTFALRGNHDDHVAGSAALWESYFETAPNIKTLPAGVTDYVSLDANSDYLTYSYIYENSMFIGLDAPGDPDLLTTAQLNWLDARLAYAETQDLTHAFIYFHGPMYPVESTHGMCETRTDASCTPADLIAVINAHPIVSATFHGHEHILGWTHMDSTRLAGLTGSFEQFITSPAGGWTYNEYVYPERLDYYYPDMSSSQGFGMVSVNGDTFTFSVYKTGTTDPVWSKTFSKGPDTISGNVGVAGATLSYTDGTPKTATADESGLYSFQVSDNWSGTVTPAQAGYRFTPTSRTYTNVTADQTAQDYTTAGTVTYYVNNTVTCSDAPGAGTPGNPFCTIGRGAYLARAGDTVHVVAGTYAEAVFLEQSGTEGNPITFHAEPGVTMTGMSPTGFGSAFAMGNRSYIVIDGFTIANTPYKGIYVDSSHHITISNNRVSYAGITSLTHPYEQGIYVRNTTYSTIAGNITDHNTCIGIRVVTGGHNLISNNISYSNYSLVETDAAGIELTGSSDNTVINNIVYSNEDSGINVYLLDAVAPNPDIPSTNNLIVGNLSYENGDHGIDDNNSPYNTFIGNTVQGNGTVGINIEGETGTGSHHATLMNNISVGNGFTPPTGSFGGNLRVDSASVEGTTIDYNLFDRQSAAVQIVWDNEDYLTLAAFQAAVPTQEVHGLEGSPLFVAPVPSVLRQDGVPYQGTGQVGDYNLTAGSPAIDSANSDAPNQPLYDIVGNERVDDPSIINTGAGTRTYDDRGAYEYLPSGSSLPTVTTQAVSDIITTTATGNGTVLALGAPNPSEHGVVWSTSPNPTVDDVEDSKTQDGPVGATGAFTSPMTGLTPGTLYYVRAYATNDAGTSYGAEVTFIAHILPAVTTQAVTQILTTTATGNGDITSLGVPDPTEHGVVWSLSLDPTIDDNKTTDGPVSATGAFSSSITGLAPNTLYHVRAYATNAAGTAYGEDVTFSTLLVPTVTTQAVTGITLTTATGNGYIDTLGIPNPTQHGVAWSTSPDPTVEGNHTSDGPVTETGAFTSAITGLAPDTLYHVRAYATNDGGTVYGEDVTFTTLNLPAVTTQDVSDITTTTAAGHGNITDLGSSNPTQHGVVWSTSANPTTADSKTEDGPVGATGAFTSSMTGLMPGTLYYVRAYATNDAGTAYGGEVTFTSHIQPAVTTQAVTGIGTTTATGNGNITSLGVPDPTEHGVVWSLSPNPTIADNKTTDGAVSATGAFTSTITGLAMGMQYHVRAYATNVVGTVYGEDVVFTTLPSSSSTTTPATNAGTGSNGSEVGTVSWLNPGYIAADDTSYASVTLNNATSYYLKGTNYGFAIPFNATVNGIQVTIGRYESGSSPLTTDIRDSVVSLLKAGAATGDNKAVTATEWPTGGAPTAATYGANNDLWGTTWTPAEINAAGFGAALSANSVANRIAYVDTMQISVTYTVTTASTTTTVDCGAGTPVVTYGSSITCVATVVRGQGAWTPSGNVDWTTGGSGTFVTSPCALSGSEGTASCSVTYTPAAVGAGSHLITATYAGDANFYTSSDDQAVTVGKKDASVTPDALSKVYGETDPALTGAIVGFLPEDGIAVTFSRDPGETVAGSPYTIGATLNGGAALDNYDITVNTANFTINKKDASVTPNPAAKVFGQPDPILTGTLTGFLTADSVTATYSRESGETVEGSPYTISAMLSPTEVLNNYNITYSTADFTITAPTVEYTLTINTIGSGTVTTVPDQPTYHYADVITLTANPAEGWAFAGWSGDASGTTNPITVTMHGNKNVTASFIFMPVLVAPSATVSTWNNTFSWTGVSDADFYQLEIYDASDILVHGQWYTDNICTGLDCAVSPAETLNLANGDYKWRVQIYGPNGYSPWTDYQTFTLNVVSIVLGEPTGPLTSWNNTFSWTGISSADFYQLEVYDASDVLVFGQWYTTSICTGLDCAVSPAETLNLANGDYKWRIRTYGSTGYTPWTDYQTFTLNVVSIVLGEPTGPLTSWNNTFSWTGISSADFYQLEVYDASDVLVFGQWYTTSICTGLDCAVSPVETLNLANGDYKWRIRTYGPNGYSPWTDHQTFTLNR